MSEKTEKILEIQGTERIADIFGAFDANAERIEKEFDVVLFSRDGEIRVSGEKENVEQAAKVIHYLERLSALSGVLSEQNVAYAITAVREGMEQDAEKLIGDTVCITAKGKPIKPKTIGQKNFVECIRKHTVTFGVGPAGTGKTFLAVAMATLALRKKEVSRIVITRPAVEAGERLGFLPGDLQSKIDPYLRPLYDALFEMLGGENYQRLVEKGSIEVAPLAYMRGRTLDDSFIILDEAQNTTPEQMKMFLTRLGNGSKMVVNGDVTQIDLPGGIPSGLIQALKICEGIEGVGVTRLTSRDVVRNTIVSRMVEAYEKAQKGSNHDASHRR
ncbi:MAG: PhoH family protein [Clostridia bacterium]|nr:PhoH family protein [Clostridia bacterium]